MEALEIEEEKPRWLFERDKLKRAVDAEKKRKAAETDRTVRDPMSGDLRVVKKGVRKIKQGHGLAAKVGVDKSWVPFNPYPPELRAVHGPRPSQAQRLASVMRVLGRPLKHMLGWPEVVGSDPQVGKSEIDTEAEMAEQKALAAHRAAITKSVEKLSQRRDVLRTELDQVEAELKALLGMLKLTEPKDEDPLPVEGKKKPSKVQKNAKADHTKGKSADGGSLARKIAVRKLSEVDQEVGLTAPELAAETGQSAMAASQMLRNLVADGVAKSLKRGHFVEA